MKIIKIFSLFAIIFAFSFIGSHKVSDAQTSTVVKNDTETSTVIDAEKLIQDIQYLSTDDLKGREAGTPENTKAKNYIADRFRESGIMPFKNNYEQYFTFQTQSKKRFVGVNVIGSIEGKTTPNKYIVITAHFDHVGVRNGKIFNGADDNASGTAALFAIADYFSNNQPNHSIIFAALDAEEKGLRGARHFVDKPPVPIGNLILNINMDMISRNDKNELYAAGIFHYPNLKKYLEPIQKTAKVKLLFGHDDPKLGPNDWTNQSDHGAFHNKKIPFIYFGVEDHKDYHKPSDQFENIQPKFYVNAVETIVMATKSIDENMK